MFKDKIMSRAFPERIQESVQRQQNISAKGLAQPGKQIAKMDLSKAGLKKSSKIDYYNPGEVSVHLFCDTKLIFITNLVFYYFKNMGGY